MLQEGDSIRNALLTLAQILKRVDTILESITTSDSWTIIVLSLKVSKMPSEVLLLRMLPNTILYYYKKHIPAVILFTNVINIDWGTCSVQISYVHSYDDFEIPNSSLYFMR